MFFFNVLQAFIIDIENIGELMSNSLINGYIHMMMYIFIIEVIICTSNINNNWHLLLVLMVEFQVLP